VVAVGLTLVEPLAEVEVKLPGVIAILVAPAETQLKVLLEPEEMLAGVALKELIDGLLAAVTVTVTVEVADPAAFVAVSV
jgi:flagellar biosynthesis protein FliR